MNKTFLIVFMYVLSISLTFLFVNLYYSFQIQQLQIERRQASHATFEVTCWYKDFYREHQRWPDMEKDRQDMTFDDSTACYKHSSNGPNGRSDFYVIVDDMMSTSMLYFEIILLEDGQCMANFHSYIQQPTTQNL
ncbi:MAG: hypothetical protein ACF8OB_08230 [Phycisphaeraceae bacterium JB051]